MVATFYCYPVGYSRFFTEAEIASIDESNHASFCERYVEACVDLSITKGYQLKSLKAEELKFRDLLHPVYIIHACDIERAYFPNWMGMNAEDLAVAAGLITRHTRALNAHFYAEEKENFHLWTAAFRTIEAGKRFAIVENLS